MNEQQPWPQGVGARYLTVAGATIDLHLYDVTPERGTSVASATCLGCTEHYDIDRTSTTRTWAQAHAEKCRALPRPEAQA